MQHLACDEGFHAAMIQRIIGWGIEMRRDDDLVRSLLFEIEAHPDWLFQHAITTSSDDADRSRYYHLRLMADAGLLDETGRHGGMFRMTNRGHDFLATIRDDTIWARTRAAMRPLGGASLSIMADVAAALVRGRLGL